MSTERPDEAGARYATGDTLSTHPVAMTDHALAQYERRTPPDAVAPAVAWRRGEDIQHPSVLQSKNHDTPPSRVRVYDHNHEYTVVFLCADTPENQIETHLVMTVYNLHTHEHGPTQAYIASHGPHYHSNDGGQR
jgi:hypothetical protein